ncbi:uncharacterized protein LOC116341316 [Contarinia nasturtii]|uniref:uncharacterized protein LOC116341316 n=1 Tax=Contarinia nasturtii TaxID=265458 RepID=UPI0012D41D29|nr:uncharacterized protein LOC116341316 [Contarinia nasturtii]
MTKIIVLLAVSSIFTLGKVNGSDLFDAVANDLIGKETQRKSAKSKQDPNAVYKSNPEAYAKLFKQFLDDFTRNPMVSVTFTKLDSFSWEGHYNTKIHMTESSRELTSLKGTLFQQKHKAVIDEKNKFILQKAYIQLSKWSSNMLKESPRKSELNMNTVQELYTEALLALQDTSATEFKEYELFFVYFYQLVKRLKGSEMLHQNQFIKDTCWDLKARHIRDLKPEDDIAKYVDTKLELITKKMKRFGEVSTEFINLYFKILENAPVVFNMNAVKKQFKAYKSKYGSSKSKDTDYRTVDIGNDLFEQVFQFGPTKNKQEKYP